MKKGFTLIELIITIALFSILAISVFWTFMVGLRVWDSGKNRADVRQEGNLAIEIMTRELSQASSITIADSDKVKFSADLNDDGEIESITLNVGGSNLNRTVEDVAVALAKNVSTLQLAYYDFNNNLLDVPVAAGQRADIRLITIVLTMNKGEEAVTLSSGVYLRNQ